MSEATSRVDELISTLGLAPHPEGGHFREVFRSALTVHVGDDRHSRTALTTIYYLLAAGQRSRWHRVRSDEVWHHYEGDPLELLVLEPGGGAWERHVLGPVVDGMRPTCTVAADHWQAARPLGEYALVGCSVGPGFDFADFTILAEHPELASHLLKDAPEMRDLL